MDSDWVWWRKTQHNLMWVFVFFLWILYAGVRPVDPARGPSNPGNSMNFISLIVSNTPYLLFGHHDAGKATNKQISYTLPISIWSRASKLWSKCRRNYLIKEIQQTGSGRAGDRNTSTKGRGCASLYENKYGSVQKLRSTFGQLKSFKILRRISFCLVWLVLVWFGWFWFGLVAFGFVLLVLLV